MVDSGAGSPGGPSLHVRDDGHRDGPPIVLVHGFLGSGRWFDDLVPLLPPGSRVVRADLLGHGRSAQPDRGYSPEDQAGALAALLDRLGIADPVVVGHSLGADVAIALIEQGVAAAKLVVISEAPDYSLADPPVSNRVLRTPVIGPLLYRALPEKAIRQSIELFLAPGRSLGSVFDDDDAIVRDFRAVPYRCFLETQREKERFAAERPLDERIAALGVPTLVVFGTRDRIFRSAESCDRYRAVPGVTVQVVPGAGHSPVAENPDLTARLITEFVGSTGTVR